MEIGEIKDCFNGVFDHTKQGDVQYYEHDEGREVLLIVKIPYKGTEIRQDLLELNEALFHVTGDFYLRMLFFK